MIEDPCVRPTEKAVARPFAVLLSQVEEVHSELLSGNKSVTKVSNIFVGTKVRPAVLLMISLLSLAILYVNWSLAQKQSSRRASY